MIYGRTLYSVTMSSKTQEKCDYTKEAARSVNQGRTDITMAKRRKTDNTIAKRRRPDNTMANRRRTKEQAIIYKTLHRKLKIEQHESH